MDRLSDPSEQRIAEMVGRDLLAPYTEATRANLLRQMQLAETLGQQRGLLTNRLVTGLLGAGGAGVSQ